MRNSLQHSSVLLMVFWWECGLAHGYLEELEYENITTAYVPRWEDVFYGSPWWEAEKSSIEKLIKKLEYVFHGVAETSELCTIQRRRSWLRSMR